ncbi:zinc ribbon-containing protein [Raoultibacter timonensis]|nr:hypothetical protein [Raoultibacter timonensis]
MRAGSVQRKENTMVYKTGEKPGKGSYRCLNCGQVVELKSDDDQLPPCPNCHHEEFEKIA